jgi:hypothetical protein
VRPYFEGQWWAAFTTPGHITFTDHIQCRYVAAVVDHERGHILEFRKYGERAIKAYGAELEPVADCASLI